MWASAPRRPSTTSLPCPWVPLCSAIAKGVSESCWTRAPRPRCAVCRSSWRSTTSSTRRFPRSQRRGNRRVDEVVDLHDDRQTAQRGRGARVQQLSLTPFAIAEHNGTHGQGSEVVDGRLGADAHIYVVD